MHSGDSIDLSALLSVCVCVCARPYVPPLCAQSVLSRCLEKCKYEGILRSSQRERILFDELSRGGSHRGELHYKETGDAPFFCHSVTPVLLIEGAATLYCISERQRWFTSNTPANKTAI